MLSLERTPRTIYRKLVEVKQKEGLIHKCNIPCPLLSVLKNASSSHMKPSWIDDGSGYCKSHFTSSIKPATSSLDHWPWIRQTEKCSWSAVTAFPALHIACCKTSKCIVTLSPATVITTYALATVSSLISYTNTCISSLETDTIPHFAKDIYHLCITMVRWSSFLLGPSMTSAFPPWSATLTPVARLLSFLHSGGAGTWCVYKSKVNMTIFALAFFVTSIPERRHSLLLLWLQLSLLLTSICITA